MPFWVTLIRLKISETGGQPSKGLSGFQDGFQYTCECTKREERTQKTADLDRRYKLQDAVADANKAHDRACNYSYYMPVKQD